MVQLYVGGLSRGVDRLALGKLMSSVAPVDSVEIVIDLETREHRGYAVVRVRDEDAKRIIKRFDGTAFEGRMLRITPMPVTLPGEMAARDWLHNHAADVFHYIGVKKGYRVLDYGCGPGIFTIPIAHIVGSTGRVYALDVRPRALERVRERVAVAGLSNVETIVQDSESVSIPLPDGSLDIGIVFDVMQDIKDKPGLLKEANRVLKPDGFLSVFPMHMGNKALLEIVEKTGLFRLRDIFNPPNSKSSSSVLNFVKIL